MKKILIVDDEPHLRQLYELEFQRAGFQTQAAANATEGLEYAKNMDPDLVVLDIRLPETDGIELMERLLNHDNTLPIIVNTAYPSYQDNYLTWAADAFLEKSSDVTNLVRTAKELT